MQYRRFGRTAIEMPVFSCGGMRYQQSWQDLPLDQVSDENQANLEATIRRALELGINHIETARGYGSSERQLGLVLPQFDRDEIIVQTKVGPNESGAEFRTQFLDSLDRLQLDYVDLLSIHGVNSYEQLHWLSREDGCLAEARQLVKEGRARHVGFSTHADLKLIEAIINVDAFGGFDYVNLHWYYIFQENWPAIEIARMRDMGVFIISPADKGGMLYDPPDRLIELCKPLHPLVFNCLFCLSRSEVHTLSLGAARPTDFDLQCSSLTYLEQANDLLPEIEQRLQAAVVDAVGAEVAQNYLDGVPIWSQMPGYINARIILWLRLLVLAFDMSAYAKMRYNLLGTAGNWFPGTNAAKVVEMDLQKSLAKSSFANEIPAWLADAHRRMATTPKARLSES